MAHTQHLLSGFGPQGSDDRLSIRQPIVRAFAPEHGAIITDHLKRPEIVQVIVTDTTTGFRHAMLVPPRFGNPASATFRRLTTPENRVKAAVAWTFGLDPQTYSPDIEA